jgi:hypothetical protein
MNLHTVVPAALVTILLVGSASARPPAEDQPYFSGDARYHAVDIGAVERNLTENLRSENDGVIGSSIAHLVRMKLAYRNRHFPRAEQALRTLVTGGRTMAIRYKAYLASAVFDEPQAADVKECWACTSPDALFAVLAARLQAAALSMNE